MVGRDENMDRMDLRRRTLTRVSAEDSATRLDFGYRRKLHTLIFRLWQ
jgi:hypothetical protein